MLAAAWEALVASGRIDEATFAQAVIGPARRERRAEWWIDRRAVDPATVPALFAAVVGSEFPATVAGQGKETRDE
ncbi:MAG: hypothetical protein QM607_02305 [Microbacterium sp.]